MADTQNITTLSEATNRRAVLGAALRTAAAVSALAVVPAAADATANDPTFAAIERHRLAFRAFSDQCLRLDGEPEKDQDTAAADAAEVEALDALCCTPPTTTAGARAGIKYVMGVADVQADDRAARAYLEELLNSPLLAD